MQVKGASHTIPFSNQVADSVWVVKFSKGVKDVQKSPSVSLLLSSNTCPGQILNWRIYLQAFCSYYLYFK